MDFTTGALYATQRSFLPDFVQINFLLLAFTVVISFAFVHFAPALAVVAAKATSPNDVVVKDAISKVAANALLTTRFIC